MTNADTLNTVHAAAHAVRPGADPSEAAALAETLGKRDVSSWEESVAYLLLQARAKIQQATQTGGNAQTETLADALFHLDGAIGCLPPMLGIGELKEN